MPPRLKRLLSRLIPLIVMVLVFYLLANMLRGVEVSDVVNAIRNFSGATLAKAIALAAFGYIWIIGYDYLALRYLNWRIPWPRMVFASLSAFALQRNVGPAPITGGAVRYRFYKKYGLSGADAAIMTALCGFFFTLGIILTAGLALLLEPQGLTRVTGIPEWLLRVGGGLVISGLLGYLAWSRLRNHPIRIRSWEAPPPSLKMSVAQLFFGTVDIAIVAGVVYVLLPDEVTLIYPAFVGIYVLAMLTGALSHVPGGIGVFEAILLLFLPGADKGELLASLLAFRGIYYLLPLVTMAAVNALYEVAKRLYRVSAGSG